MANNISSYILQCQRLLHDSSNQFYSNQQLTDYINDARLRVVRDTGCLRQLIQVPLLSSAVITGGISSTTLTVTTIVSGGSGQGISGIAIGVGQTVTINNVTTFPPVTIISQLTGTPNGVGTYQLSGTTLGTISPGTTINLSPVEKYPYTAYSDLQLQNLGLTTDQKTIDVININVIWGNSRLVVDYLPWSRFNYWLRGWTLLQGRPIVFSNYAQNTVYLGPMPDQTYVSEWDVVFAPNVLVQPTDVEQIPIPFQQMVPFYACYLAKQQMQEWDESAGFFKQYKLQLNSALNSAFTRRLTRVQ